MFCGRTLWYAETTMWGIRPLTEPVSFDGASLEKMLWALRDCPDLVALFGSGAQLEVGRYGFLALPESHHSWHKPIELKDIFSLQEGKLGLLGLSYEYGQGFNFLPEQSAPRGQPSAFLTLFDSALVLDFVEQTYVLVGEEGQRSDVLWQASQSQDVPRWADCQGELVPQVSDKEHGRRILRTQEHIRAGDIYQANITRRLALQGQELDALALFCRLSQTNPVAHGAYLRLDGFEMLSNSMETLLTYEPSTREAASYPIKGTCARASGASEPANLALDEKEKAEHVMIVDLVRNDLGKVCQSGTVSVPRLLGVDGFWGVWHGVSKVRGTLAEDKSPADLLAALFPGGSITGAPKRRAMQIIAELEGEGRGLYTGSLALLKPDGSMSASILIRTLVKDETGWNISVGGGIVADSRPEREITETWEKVGVFKRLLSQALDGA